MYVFFSPMYAIFPAYFSRPTPHPQTGTTQPYRYPRPPPPPSPTAAHVTSELTGNGAKGGVLKIGCVMPPNFPVGDVSLHDATYTIVRVK